MSDASRIVEKMRLKGLLERTICEKDRRSVDVTITKSGLDLLKKTDTHDLRFDENLNNLSEKELDQLNYLLDKLRKD